MAEERVPLEIRRAEPEDAAELLSIYAPYVEESWVTFECVPPTVEEFRRRMEEFSALPLSGVLPGGRSGLRPRPPHGAGGLPVERGAHCLCAPGSGGLGDRHRPLRSSQAAGKWGWSTCTGCWDCPTGSEAPPPLRFTPAGLYPRMGFGWGSGTTWPSTAPPHPRTGRRAFFRTKGGDAGMIWKYLLRIWGWVCLLAAALHGALTLYAAAVPYNIYQPGSTGLAEWLGMGLISHGLAHVMARLDELG